MARLVLDLLRHGDALPAGPGGDAARVLSPTGRRTLEPLGPDSSPLQVLDALRRTGVAEHHALLIGHQPLLGQVAALLANAEASFAPGSLVRIEFTAGPAMGAGRIARTLHPRELDT